MVDLAIDEEVEGSPDYSQIVVDPEQRIVDAFFYLGLARLPDAVGEGFKGHLRGFTVAHEHHGAAGECGSFDGGGVSFGHSVEHGVNGGEDGLLVSGLGGGGDGESGGEDCGDQKCVAGHGGIVAGECELAMIGLEIVPNELNSTAEDFPVELQSVDTSAKSFRWFELVLVLVLAFGGSFLNSLYLMRTGKAGVPAMSGFRWARGFAQEIPCLLLLWYVLSRRRLSFRNIGLRWSVRDVVSGIGLLFVSYVVYMVGGFIIFSVHHAFFPLGTSGVTAADLSTHSVLAIPFALINPFFEELIVRAYLMTEVKSLTGSWTVATALSVIIQWSYHLYYGWDGSLSIAFTFLVFSIYFARTRKATPLIVAHGLLDLWALAYWR